MSWNDFELTPWNEDHFLKSWLLLHTVDIEEGIQLMITGVEERLSDSTLIRLQAWPIASEQLRHRPSKIAGLDQYFGNRENKVCFKSLSSFVGKAGNRPCPIVVHCIIMSGPKNASLANFTARIVALLSVCSLGYRSRHWPAGTSFVLLIEEDGRLFVLVGIARHFADGDDEVYGNFAGADLEGTEYGKWHGE